MMVPMVGVPQNLEELHREGATFPFGSQWHFYKWLTEKKWFHNHIYDEKVNTLPFVLL